jgi:hypothetical protein
MSRLDELRERVHRRKRNRERRRRLHQGGRARREGRAIGKLRELIEFLRLPRTMYDSVTVGNIPPAARAVAGYVNGNYQTMPELRARFPKARKVSIAVASAFAADCLDVEPGDASNADAPRWYRRFKARRSRAKPIFYTSASNVDALLEELDRSGIPRHAYLIWSAHYTDSRHVCSPRTCGYPAADATQWTTHGETVDESAVRPHFWKESR